MPDFLWAILAPYGRQLRPALLHDFRCDVAAGRVASTPGTATPPAAALPGGTPSEPVRREADELFREALRSEGVGPGRAWLFWTGVSFGRFFAFNRVPAALLAAAGGRCSACSGCTR